MRLLFFVEPLIEMGRPYWKDYWANIYGKIIRTLEKSTNTFEYCMAFNEPISQKFEHRDNVKEVVFTQEELLAFPGKNYLDLSIDWYKGTFSQEQLDYCTDLVKNKFGDFSPDVVFTLTPVPYIKQAFPAALILHMEVSLFSRPPYPLSYQLDPCGVYFHSFLIRNKKQLQQYKIDSRQRQQLETFKKEVQRLFSETCPFKETMLGEKNKFDYLILVPLQLSGTYAFDALCEFRSQYDFLDHVLRNVPQNIGVVVTTHPEYDILERDTIRYLSSKYPHFIYHEEFKEYTTISQYLIAYVDAVVTVGSSVGLQTLIWDKKLIEIGYSHLDCIADAHSLNDLQEVLAKSNRDKSPIAYWLITRYAIQEKYIFDPVWLTSFISKMVKRYREEKLNFESFEVINEEEKLFSELKESLDINIPYFSSNLSLSELHRIVEQYGLSHSRQHAKLYIDVGAGFSNQRVIVKKIKGDETALEYVLTDDNIKQLMFVPLTTQHSLNLNSILIVDEQNNVYPVNDLSNTNALLNIDKLLIFNTENPNIIIDVSQFVNKIQKLIINLHYREIGISLLKQLPEYLNDYRFAWIQFFKKINNKKLVVFGTGSASYEVCKEIPIKIDYFVDNNSLKWGEEHLGLKIHNPLKLQREKKDCLAIIIASQYYSEIAAQLQEIGLKENIHFWNGLKLYYLIGKNVGSFMKWTI